MLRLWSVARLRAELGALVACAKRAGIALACVRCSADAPMAAEIRACRAAAARALAWLPRWMTSRAAAWPPEIAEGMRLVIVAAALAFFAALAVLSALAL
jgi:hypothetical protein